MDIEHQDIKRFLRQRAPFLLVDRITYLDAERVVGIKNISGTDPFLEGHFDDGPILPGVVLIEAMSQVGGVLLAHDERFKHATGGFLAGVDKMKFKKFVIPGDQVEIEAGALVAMGSLARLTIRARVGNEEVAAGEVSYFMQLPSTTDGQLDEGSPT
jgi:3-hydroxyacyl-[acyl-carrier-protein] dehydratase